MAADHSESLRPQGGVASYPENNDAIAELSAEDNSANNTLTDGYFNFQPGVIHDGLRSKLRRDALERTILPTIALGGRLIIDHEVRDLYVDGELVEFTRKEFNLLSFFVSQSNKVYSKTIILERVWGDKFRSDQTLFEYIRRIKRKVGKDDIGKHIETVWCVGYRFRD